MPLQDLIDYISKGMNKLVVEEGDQGDVEGDRVHERRDYVGLPGDSFSHYVNLTSSCSNDFNDYGHFDLEINIH